LNTAYIERLNGTFRSRLAALGRRSRCLARQAARWPAGVYLVGTIYNFCTVHQSLPRANKQQRTPAQAAGITDHGWSVAELLHYQVPLPQWVPPKRRGRPAKAYQAVCARWAA
jgi:hypothetical protein